MRFRLVQQAKGTPRRRNPAPSLPGPLNWRTPMGGIMGRREAEKI